MLCTAAVGGAGVVSAFLCMQVWDVLTDYEALPEFVPNLALCERLSVPAAMGSRLTRLRQVHCGHVFLRAC